ncbi:arginine--tRNA ligase, partial [Candidatus Woesearchaeota archaeon]|nr:arginine--tRNA ligase [Candidatus Woesearchaeota archaeon]
KPQHIGHVRNNLLGMSISKILDFAGYRAVKANIINDRGMHICKSMLMYKLFGKNKEPDKKPDHFVGDFYVMFNKKVKTKPELEKEVYDMLKKWEEGDKETLALWRKMNNWVYKGFEETYENLGVKFDTTYYESQIYKKGKKIVEDAVEKGIFVKNEEGAVIAPLGKFNLPDKVVLRADGTAIYATQDLQLAKARFEEYNMDKLIYVVGSEHILYFQQLFAIFHLLNFEFADKCAAKHYGMINLEGAKLKSREGKVVDADDVIKEMVDLARSEVKKRYKELSEKEVEFRSKAIGPGALKFFMLKQVSIKDINFVPKESLSFEGETGPYVQYVHARISSILRKYGKSAEKDIDFSLLKTEQEEKLVRLLADFPETVEYCSKNLEPSTLAHYLISVAQAFNDFYHNCPVLTEEEGLKKARIFLVSCTKQAIKNGLSLFGIEALEEM